MFEDLLYYIYTGQVKKLNYLAGELVYTADKYDLQDLNMICEQKLISMISVDNCIDLSK